MREVAHRLFVAVHPPEKVLDAVGEVAARAQRALVGPRWTTRDQWHLTLQFLGSVPEDRLDAVRRALEATSAVQPFPVRLGGGGAFPRPSRGRVIWVGLAAGAEPMAGLARAVHRALRPLGYEPEARAFHPHLTLARLAVPGDVQPALEALGDGPVGPAFVVDEVVLFESHLRRTGAVYEARARVPLLG